MTTALWTADAPACSPEPIAFDVQSMFPLGQEAKLNGAVYVALEEVTPINSAAAIRRSRS